jgi:acetyl-CoA C-acetyltransferase
VSERVHLSSSTAIRRAAQQALGMAGRTLADMRFFDVYSCFPAAVEIACQEIGLAEDDPRGLTVTGGLPYFGGPGNNYVTHAIAELMRRLRAHRGSFGMITANGNYVTKHSIGIYSTTPWLGRWRREDPSRLQAELDALPKAPLVRNPSGIATIETYTITHSKEGPEFSVLFGRLKETGQRFIANTVSDRRVLEDLQEQDSLGRPGVVRFQQGRNLFVPESAH